MPSLSYQGTVSSAIMMVLVLLDSRTISGRREVTATSCGKTTFLFRFTLNSQSEARCKEEDGFLATVPVL